MYLKYFRQKRATLDERIEIRESNLYTFILKKQKIILGGKFYYFNSFAKKIFCFLRNLNKN